MGRVNIIGEERETKIFLGEERRYMSTVGGAGHYWGNQSWLKCSLGDAWACQDSGCVDQQEAN